MKNTKSFKSAHSRPFSRSSAVKSKPRRSEEEVTRLPGDARPRHTEKSKSKSADAANARSKDLGKSKFKREGKPFFKDTTKPRFREDAKPHAKSDRTERRVEDKTKPTYKAGLKPGFRGGAKNHTITRTTARPLTREEFLPSVNTTLVWGIHAARAAWLNPKRRVHRLWLTESGQKLFEATQNEAKDELLKRPDAKRLDREDLDRIAPPGSVHQGIVIEVAPLPDPALHEIIGMDPPPDLILLLDQVTDPHNVGAILRSASAFGAGAVVMTERNAPNTTGVLAKSASGALEHIPMVHVVNLARTIDELREAGYWCVGLAEEGEKSLSELDVSGRTALVLGNEGDGLRHLTRQKCDELARLPTGGPVASLNVSNAAAVALYEVRRQSK